MFWANLLSLTWNGIFLAVIGGCKNMIHLVYIDVFFNKQ